MEIPVKIVEHCTNSRAELLSKDIPLLLNKKAMKDAEVNINFLNWNSLHARLNSHYKVRSYKKKKHKKIETYKKSIYKEPSYKIPLNYRLKAI